MKKIKYLALIISLMSGWLITPSVFAVMSSSWSPACGCIRSTPCGWYGELNFGGMHLGNSHENGGDLEVHGIGASINVGYKFLPYMAMEAGYTIYPNTDINAPTPLLCGSDITAAILRLRGYDLAFKGILPIMDSGMELFAKLGYQRTQARINIEDLAAATSIGITTNSSQSSSGIYSGLGGQYYFTPDFAVVLQWQRVEGHNSSGEIDFFSIGISYIWG